MQYDDAPFTLSLSVGLSRWLSLSLGVSFCLLVPFCLSPSIYIYAYLNNSRIFCVYESVSLPGRLREAKRRVETHRL